MRIQILGIFALAATLFCFSPLVHAQSPDHNAAGSIQLSPELGELLNQEMEAIQNGMMSLIPAIAAGEWSEVAAIGKKIKASFIMKQKLTQTQKEELHQVLPKAFIEMDQAFHKSAGMLAHAAEMKNAEVVGFYFFKLNEACASCHGKFASKRFPGFAKKPGEEKSGH